MPITSIGKDLYLLPHPSGEHVKIGGSYIELPRFKGESLLKPTLQIAGKPVPELRGNRLAVGNSKIQLEQFVTPVNPAYNEFGGIDQIITLYSKPQSNQVIFDYDATKLIPYHQPPLTQTEIDEGCIRPVHVVNSIAWYHNTKGGLVTLSDIDQGITTGKAFHQYRMMGNGKFWCDWELRQNGQYVLIIPEQEWAKPNNYPMTLSPVGDTFGYITAGGSAAEYYNNELGARGNVLQSPRTGVTGDTVTNYSWYGRNYAAANGAVGLTAYTVVSAAFAARLAAATSVAITSQTPAWWTTGAVSQTLVNGAVYNVAMCWTSSNYVNFYYDTGSGNEFDRTSSTTLNETWSHSVWETKKASIYAIYTPATSNVTCTPTTKALTITTFIPSVNLSDNKTVTPSTLSLTLIAYAPVPHQWEGMEQLIIGGNPNTGESGWDISPSQTKWTPFFCGGRWDGSECDNIQLITSYGLIKNLLVELDSAPSAGRSYTFTLRKKAGASAYPYLQPLNSTSLEVVIADSDISGADLTHSVSVVPGDIISFQSTPSNSPPSVNRVRWSAIFLSENTYESLLPVCTYFDKAGGSTWWTNVYNGSNYVREYESYVKQIFPTSGIIKNLACRTMLVPGSDRTIDITVRVNGVDSDLTIHFGSADRYAEDITHSAVVAAGDIVTVKVAFGGTGYNSVLSAAMGMTFVAAINGESVILGGTGEDALDVAVTEYLQPTYGFPLSTAWSATLANRYNGAIAGFTFKKLYTLLSAVPNTGNSRKFTFFHNGATDLITTHGASDTTKSDLVHEIATLDYGDLSMEHDPTGTPDASMGFWGLAAYKIPIGAAYITPNNQTLTLTTYIPTIKYGVIVPVKALVITQYIPVLKVDIITGTLALATTTYAPTVSTSSAQVITPTYKALTITRYAPTLKAVIPIGLRGLAITTYAPTVSSGGNVLVTPNVKALTLTRYAPVLKLVVTPSTLALAVTKYVPTITIAGFSVVLTPATLALILTTYAPFFPTTRILIVTGVSTTEYDITTVQSTEYDIISYMEVH